MLDFQQGLGLRQSEIADRDDMRSNVVGLRMAAAVAERVELLGIAEIEPRLLSTHALSPISKVRCCNGENGPKGSPSVAPASSVCSRMISTTGSFSATATIAAFKPISTPATSVRDAPSALRSVVTTDRFNCAGEVMLVLQWFLEPPNEADIRLDRGSFLIIGRLANDLIAAIRMPAHPPDSGTAPGSCAGPRRPPSARVFPR